MRRAAAAGIGVVLLLALLIVGFAWLLGTLLGQQLLTLLLPVIGLVLAALLAIRLVRGIGRAAAPLGELMEASARVEAGEVGTQVKVRGPREIRALGRAFNAMSAQLAETDAERRHLLADVSHELRTPLTVIQGNIEGILDGLYAPDRALLERTLAETHRLERLIEDLRTLSMADAGALSLQREPTDLGALAADVVAAFEPQAASGRVALAVEAVDGLPDLEVDPLRVRQVITNLVANALRHTPSGGRIAVSVAPDGDGQVLSVTDTGSGMDAESASHAFDRFWRSSDSSGAGLGLAIARDLMRAHGGEVELDSSIGVGTTVVCRFRP